MVKVQFRSTTRRLSLSQPQPETFHAAVTSAFGLSAFAITYVDADGDTITVGSDAELQEALNDNFTLRVSPLDDFEMVNNTANASKAKVRTVEPDEEVDDDLYAEPQTPPSPPPKQLPPVAEDPATEASAEAATEEDPAQPTEPTLLARIEKLGERVEVLTERYLALIEPSPEFVDRTHVFFKNIYDTAGAKISVAYSGISSSVTSLVQGQPEEAAPEATPEERFNRDVQVLKEMGFTDEERIKEAWLRNGGNLAAVVESLLL